MPILKPIKTPFGAALGYHLVTRIEADPLSKHASVIATVRSWPDEESYVAAEGRGSTWQEVYPVPVSALVPTALGASCEVHLAAAVATPFAGGSLCPLPDDLQAARFRQWALIKQSRSILLAQPIEAEGLRLDADEAGTRNIMGALMSLQLSNAESVAWTLADNTRTTIPAAKLRAIGVAIAARTDAIHATAAKVREAIFAPALRTVAEVQAVGWPVRVPPLAPPAPDAVPAAAPVSVPAALPEPPAPAPGAAKPT